MHVGQRQHYDIPVQAVDLQSQGSSTEVPPPTVVYPHLSPVVATEIKLYSQGPLETGRCLDYQSSSCPVPALDVPSHPCHLVGVGEWFKQMPPPQRTPYCSTMHGFPHLICHATLLVTLYQTVTRSSLRPVGNSRAVICTLMADPAGRSSHVSRRDRTARSVLLFSERNC